MAAIFCFDDFGFFSIRSQKHWFEKISIAASKDQLHEYKKENDMILE